MTNFNLSYKLIVPEESISGLKHRKNLDIFCGSLKAGSHFGNRILFYFVKLLLLAIIHQRDCVKLTGSGSMMYKL